MILRLHQLKTVCQQNTLHRFSSVGRASDSQIFWEHEFESWQPHLCNSMWGQDWQQASHQEVGTCRGGSRGTYITFASAMWLRQPTLALKPRGDITRNPKQGYQWPQNRTHVSAKNLKKTTKKNYTTFFPQTVSSVGTFITLGGIYLFWGHSINILRKK